jgi:hypothetical protein
MFVSDLIPEGFGRKTFRKWTRYEPAARNENQGSVILYVAVLVIDCYWCGFLVTRLISSHTPLISIYLIYESTKPATC